MEFLKKLDQKVENINKKWELIIVVFLSAILVFGIIIGMGTLTCGWHLVDDHQFLKWTYLLRCKGESLWEVLTGELAEDFSLRFRPAHVITRVLEASLFGQKLPFYSMVKAFEVVLCNIFLYYCGRRMGAKKIGSFLFAVLSLTGYQSATWWKLGTHEIQSTLLFAAGFYCMLRWLSEKKKKWAVSSIVLFFVMSNFKESFIMLAPFLVLYVLYSDLINQNSEESTKIGWKQLWMSVKNNLGYLSALIITFIIPLIVIIFFVGVNSYDTVGVDLSRPLENYAEAIGRAFQTDLKWYKRFGIIFLLILLTYWDDLKKLWKEILLGIAFILPQFVIYGETGITERYILPASIGFAFFFVIVILKWKPLSGKRRMIYMLGLLLLLGAHGRAALREADYFRYRGESVTTMLESVLEMSKGEKNILSCLRPNEEGNATIYYWMAVHGFDNIYFWTEEEQTIDQIITDRWLYAIDEEQDETTYAFEDMDIVVMYNKEDRHWCYTPTLDLSDFKELKCGTLTVYVRNDRGIDLVDSEIEGLRINF
ncbi:MAG: glycosyltransferase family 39 protein [Lachnospiraceae bacterium]|nr:glycosyltransferase family 39 protein [Lachnospiraceae bacterium]